MMRDMRAAVGLAAFFLCAAMALAQRAPGAPQLGSEVTSGGGGSGDITAVGDCTSGDCLTSGTTTMAGAAVFSSATATDVRAGIQNTGSATCGGVVAGAACVSDTNGLVISVGSTTAQDALVLKGTQVDGTGPGILATDGFSNTVFRLNRLFDRLNFTVSSVPLMIGNVSIVTGFGGSVVSPTALSATTNDWAGCGNTFRCRASATTSSRDLTGMVPGSQSAAVAIWRELCNVGSIDIVLKHENAGSAAANRFIFSGATDRTLVANSCILLSYDATTARWRALGPVS